MSLVSWSASLIISAGVAETMHPWAADEQGQQHWAEARLQVQPSLSLTDDHWYYCWVTWYLNLEVWVFLPFFGRKPAVIMIVGVNGGGKTTSLGTSWHALLSSRLRLDVYFVTGLAVSVCISPISVLLPTYLIIGQWTTLSYCIENLLNVRRFTNFSKSIYNPNVGCDLQDP
jgi:hypothetical protein